MVEIEMGKTYRTRDERDYRLYATDAGGPYPVHGAVLDPCNGRWIHTTHALDGCYERNRPNHPSDLIEVEPTRTRTQIPTASPACASRRGTPKAKGCATDDPPCVLDGNCRAVRIQPSLLAQALGLRPRAGRRPAVRSVWTLAVRSR